MYLVRKETFNILPIHDSDFLNLNLSQSKDGIMDLRLTIAFYEDEIDLIDEEVLSLLGKRNEADLLFCNCHWIDLNGYYMPAGNDLFDHIQFLNKTPQLERFGTKDVSLHVKIDFISGSKLECVFEEAKIVKAEL